MTFGDLQVVRQQPARTSSNQQPQEGDTPGIHNSLRAIGERGNSLPKMTFKALRNVSLNPWRIGKIVALDAALVILHIEHDRTR